MDNEPLTIGLETEKLRSYDMQTDSSLKHLSDTVSRPSVTRTGKSNSG